MNVEETKDRKNERIERTGNRKGALGQRTKHRENREQERM